MQNRVVFIVAIPSLATSNINDRTGQSPVLRLPRHNKIRALSHDRFIISLMPEVSAIVTENGREQDITDINFDRQCRVSFIIMRYIGSPVKTG
jgi:hypothetical protein